MSERISRCATLLCSCLLLGTAALGQTELRAKDVAAPPGDVLSGRLRLPDPARTALRSRTALVPVAFERVRGSWTFETQVPIERPVAGERLTFLFLHKDGAPWAVSVERPDGARIALDDPILPMAIDRRSERVTSGPWEGHFADRFDIDSADPGNWTLFVRVTSATPPSGTLVVASQSPLVLESHVDTHELVADGAIGIVARVLANADATEPLAGAVTTAAIAVTGPRGPFRLPMHDDGQHADGAAGDGVFGARLPGGLSGDVRARVVVRGTAPSGEAFLRTSDHAFPVLERAALLTGEASGRVLDDLRLAVDIGAWVLAPGRKLHVSAEVWGHAAGTQVPVAWLSRMQTPNADASSAELSLALDGRWLALANATPPLELRNLRVQDPDTHVVFDLVERVPVRTAALPASASGPAPEQPTPSMMTGPPSSAASVPGKTPIGPHAYTRALMLIHGYCSGGSIWPAADFSEPKLEFLDPNQNRTHDEFAQLIAQNGEHLGSFGIVGHSQGGPASLHLYTYYESGLDSADGPRRIQSVGSPYQGTPLASLGFFACGVNRDMEVAGAAAWLAGIPTWARQEVSYWTTRDDGSACEPLANFFLDSNNNDGTTEMFRGQLPGANSMGHIEGWCHTTGMSDPPQYRDASRNAEMNTQAAR